MLLSTARESELDSVQHCRHWGMEYSVFRAPSLQEVGTVESLKNVCSTDGHQNVLNNVSFKT